MALLEWWEKRKTRISDCSGWAWGEDEQIYKDPFLWGFPNRLLSRQWGVCFSAAFPDPPCSAVYRDRARKVTSEY